MSEELKVSKIMKSLMEDRKETLISLSKKTGVPKSTLSEWLGNRTPNPLQAIKVANYFGVSLHHLLFGSEDKSEPLAKI